MSEIIDFNSIRPDPPIRRAGDALPRTRRAPSPAAENELTADTVEFSDASLALAKAASKVSMRMARVQLIRAQIQAGTYETPERIARTVDRLLEHLT